MEMCLKKKTFYGFNFCFVFNFHLRYPRAAECGRTNECWLVVKSIKLKGKIVN